MGWGDNTKGPWGDLGKDRQKPANTPPSGSSGGPKKPSGNKGGGPNKPFEFEKFFKKPSGSGGQPVSINAKGIMIIILIAVIGWAMTGFYVVDASEEGIVLRLGKYHRTAPEGLRYHLPSPLEHVYIVKKTVINSIQIGYRSSINQAQQANAQRNYPRYNSKAQGSRDDMKQPKESLMITGDTNIADVSFTVQWRIKDSFNYLFQVADPADTMNDTIKAVSESAMREVIGRTNFAEAMTTKRAQIEEDVKNIIQNILNSYKSGVEIYAVNLNDVQNPEPVMPAFLDVETAKQDKETSINRALAYQNEIIPKARGDAQQIIQDAEAYKQQVTSIANGEAQRFASVYNEYAKAKDITRKRIYLETMQAIMAGTDKVIIDDSKNGVMPYLPLPELKKHSDDNADAVEKPQASAQQNNGSQQ